MTLQRRQAESRGACAGGRAPAVRARLGRTSRWPKRESSAGSTVSEASSVSNTASTEAIDSP